MLVFHRQFGSGCDGVTASLKDLSTAASFTNTLEKTVRLVRVRFSSFEFIWLLHNASEFLLATYLIKILWIVPNLAKKLAKFIANQWHK